MRKIDTPRIGLAGVISTKKGMRMILLKVRMVGTLSLMVLIDKLVPLARCLQKQIGDLSDRPPAAAVPGDHEGAFLRFIGAVGNNNRQPDPFQQRYIDHVVADISRFA